MKYKASFVPYTSKLFIYAIIILLSGSNLFAQTNELRFKYLTTNEGLSSNIVTCIAQDKYGFIWIGSELGLNRYNGYEVKIFDKKLNDPTSISDNAIIDIFIDSDDNMWVGTRNGICLYDEDSETFSTTMLNPEQKNINTANRIPKITEDSKRNLITCVESGFLFIYDKKKKSFKKDTTFLGRIRDFEIDKNDVAWLAGEDGLLIYNLQTRRLKKIDAYSFKGKTKLISQINSVYQEGDTVWVGTVFGEVLYLLKHDLSVHEFGYKFPNDCYINNINKISDGLIYISTTSGLFTYNKNNQKITTYKYSKDDRQGINTYGVSFAFEDKQGNQWIGTTQGGVNISTRGKPFNNYNLYSKGITLDQINIKAITEDRLGNLWLGSFTNGINVINPKTNKRKFFEHDDNNSSSSIGFGTVNFIYNDSKDRIWTGTYTGPFQQFDKKNNCFVNHEFNLGTSKKDKWVRDIRSMVEDDEGNLWLIAHSNGLIKYNPETKDFKVFKQDFNNIENSLADNWPFYIIKGSKGYLWIGTPSGLSRLNPKNEEFKNYYKGDEGNGLCDNFINTVFEDSKSNLWIGTNFGLDLFDRNKVIFHHFFEEDGLPGNQIVGILEQSPGELWLSTGNGLSKFNYEYDKTTGEISTEFRNYNKSDNLQDDFFWPNSACRLKNGKLAFGGENGLVMFNPDDIKDNEVDPEVYITDFKLFNKSVKIGEYDSLLRRNIINTDEINLKYNQNYVAFNFVAINYISIEKNKFKYLLEGFDKDWVNIGNKREASYTNLDPGEYVFRVKASNNDGVWNEEGTSIKINIKPPFWATPAFMGLGIFAMIFIIALYLYSRYNKLNQQRKNLELKVQERTAELEELNEELRVKHAHIIDQNNEIKIQADEISAKGDEIMTQNEKLEEQKNEIEKAYEELKLYRTQLEDLVDERTKELIEAKEKAEESDRLKTSFLTNMSHEIRTPLNSIIGFSGLLIEDDIEKEHKNRYKYIIDINSRALLGLISDIIDFSKIESGQIELKQKEVNTDNILEDVKDIYELEVYKMQSGQKNDVEFIIKNENAPKQLIFKSDEVRIKQILTVLINNAFKFTKKGYVEVGCYTTENGFLNFYVKDTGIGIQEKFHKVIFNRFRKIEDDISTLYRGAGLGLSISKHLVKLLGGKIWVESEPDKGSVFTFSIPLKEDEQANEDSYKQKLIYNNIPDLSDKTILVAEDDDSNFFFLERLLIKTKANLIHAKNGKEVILKVAINKNIDLILMDIKMPEMTGIQALDELNKQECKIPAIAQTAYAFASEIHRIQEAGFSDYITKPIDPNKLYRLINKTI